MNNRKIILFAIVLLLALLVVKDQLQRTKVSPKKNSSVLNNYLAAQELKNKNFLLAKECDAITNKFSAANCKFGCYKNHTSPRGQLQQELNRIFRSQGLPILQFTGGNEVKIEKVEYFSNLEFQINGKVDIYEYSKWCQCILQMENQFPASRWRNLQLTNTSDNKLQINGSLVLSILNDDAEQLLKEAAHE